MDFRILGPLGVSDRDGPVRLAGARQRALLALLLIRANRVVPADVLIEELWGGEVPRNAVNALQAAVSRVRKAIGEERLRSRPPGYVLEVGADELDLARFERLAAEGRAALAGGDGVTASQRFASALALWRGPPLAEFVYESFAQREIARLDELRLTVTEDRIEADLSLGRHAALVGELEALVGEHPLRERLRAQLMLALYRSGRQAEALACYQTARRAGVDELGIEPTRALRELEAAILRQDPALDLPASPAPDQPAPPVAAVAPPREGRKLVTVVFSDVVESTALGEGLDPERLRSVMGRYFEAMSQVLERHGGSIEKYIGDAVMAVFGVPTMHEDDALRAVRAAAEMGERLVRLNEELERDAGVVLAARTGVNTGEVVVGDGRHGGASITGRAVNIAKRLEQAAQPGEVLLGGQTREHVRDAVRCEQLEPLSVKGARGPVAAWRLVEVLPETAAGPTAEVALVGRSGERARLRRAFDAAIAGRACRLVTVLGQPGIGKSRLLRELADELGGRASTVLGRCLPYGEGITYWPLVEIARELFGADLRAGLSRVLAGDELGPVVANRIAAAVGIGEPAGASEETHWAIRRLLEALAAQRPLVLVFEDIHWAEPTFLDLVEYLAGFAAGPILLACAARPELLETRPEWAVPRAGAELVQLEPLSATDADELVERRLAGRPLTAGIRAQIVAAAEGNPLFVDQMVALAVEQPGGDDTIRVPPTISALLASRIDRLPEAERRLLEHGSVEGRVFHRGALAELLPSGERSELAGGLMALVRRGLITPYRSDHPGDDAFRFGHILIRDAAYASLSKERRAELHLGFAGWLDRVAGDRALEQEEIGGYHLERAFHYREELGLGAEPQRRELGRRAAARLEAAGRRAAERGDLPAACSLLERALRTLTGDASARAAVLPELGAALIEAGRLDDAACVLEEACSSGDALVWAHARIQQLVLTLYTEPAHAGAGFESDRDAIARRLAQGGDELGLCRLWRLEGMMRWFGGRSGEAIDAWERASQHARRAAGTRELVDLLVWQASALLWGPTPVADAIRRCEAIREEVGLDRAAEADVEKRLACLHAMSGDFVRARERLESSRLAFEDLGETIHAAQTEPYAFVARLQGEPAEAEVVLRAGLERLEEMGERSFRSTLAGLLAQALVAQERYADAAPFVEMAAGEAAAGDLVSQVVWRTARASILAGQGDLDGAERLDREAVGIAEQTDLINDRAECWSHLAGVLELADRSGEAAEAARRALELYERKGNAVAAARLRPRLEALEHRARA